MSNRNLRQRIYPYISWEIRKRTNAACAMLRDMSQSEKNQACSSDINGSQKAKGRWKVLYRRRSSQKSQFLRNCLKVRTLILSDVRLNIRELVQERNLDKNGKTEFKRWSVHETKFRKDGPQYFWLTNRNEGVLKVWFVKNDHWRWNVVFSIWSGKETIKQWIIATYLSHQEARMTKSPMIKMLTTFFHIRSIVYCEFAPQDQTVNQASYEELLMSCA